MKKKIGMTMMIGGRLAASALFFLLIPAAMAHAGRQQPITANLTAPKAVALDAGGNLYVVESATNRLHLFNTAGEYVRSFTNLDKPVSVAVDGRGRIFIGNAGRRNVEVYGQDFTLLFKLGSGDGEFALPGGMTTDSLGRVYVVDSKNDEINVYNPDGSFRFFFGASGSQSGRFHFPTAVAVNDAAQELYVADLPQMQTRDGLAEGARIQVFTLRGVYKRGFGTYGQGDGLLTRPAGVAVDGDKGLLEVDIGDKDAIYVPDPITNLAPMLPQQIKQTPRADNQASPEHKEQEFYRVETGPRFMGKP